MTWVNGDLDKVMAALGLSITAETIAMVDSKMDALVLLSSDAVARCQGYLTSIAAIESAIATNRVVANGSSFIGQLKPEGRRFVSLLSRTLGVEIASDVFGSGG